MINDSDNRPSSTKHEARKSITLEIEDDNGDVIVNPFEIKRALSPQVSPKANLGQMFERVMPTAVQPSSD